MIEQLIRISRYYGKLKGYALGGGGNTSFKTEDTLWVKASGYQLADISEDCFAVLNRGLLRNISFRQYSSDPFEREREVKDDLISSNIFPDRKLRPSVEASLHDLIEYAYVVHTHPFVVNALTCSRNARVIIHKLFPDDTLFVPYVDPGYILFKRIERELVNYKKVHKRHPRIIFLQNHGVFVSAGQVNEIKSIYEMIFTRIRKLIRNELKITAKSFRYDRMADLIHIFRQLNDDGALAYKTRNNSMVSYFTSGLVHAGLIANPFIPDQIVYCRTHPHWLRASEKSDLKKIETKLRRYKQDNGFLPRIVLIENEGMMGFEISEQSAGLVLDVFEDAMKIAYYSMNFGGPHFMTHRQISFIESWEVENYRRNLLVK
ncbi:MAG TPA: class II aldolase/adducin family protein [Cyclobacteriaceae bacterium]|nr:class II aldolase/adducin family protein [Cyclobacteriaceae bacterium]